MSARRKKPTPEQLAVEEEERELLRRFCALPSLRQNPFLAKAINAHPAGVQIEAEVRVTPGTG
jgi:hypothetical protein